MALTNMKQKKQSKDQVLADAMPEDEYPWGLRISLNTDDLEKLGIDLPAVGAEMRLQARVEVVSANMHERKGGKMDLNCDLQITDMQLTKKEDGSVMFDNTN